MSDSLPNWKKEFFYNFIEVESRETFFRPNISRAITGTFWDMILGFDERAVVDILIGDCIYS